MKKTIFWNDYTHNVRAVLGAFVLAAAGLGALACEGVADPPASKPPEVPSEENPPKVTNLTGSRGGDAEEIITLAWTDPIPANSFDSIEITFKPEDTAVPQPISVDKGEKGKEITGLKSFRTIRSM